MISNIFLLLIIINMNPKHSVSSVNKLETKPFSIKKHTENHDTTVLSEEKSVQSKKKSNTDKEMYDEIKWLTCC